MKNTTIRATAVLALLAAFLSGPTRADSSQIGMATRSAYEIYKVNQDNQREFNDFMGGQLAQLAIVNASQVASTARIAQKLTELLQSDMSPASQRAFTERRGALVGMGRQVSDLAILFSADGRRLVDSPDSDDQRAGLAFLLLSEIPGGGSPMDILNMLTTCISLSDSGAGLPWLRTGNFGQFINQLSPRQR